MATGTHDSNIFRWYRAGWGRYTQPDPYDREPLRNVVNAPAVTRDQRQLGTATTYGYAVANPLYFSDPLGLVAVANCGCKPVLASGNPGPGQGGGQQLFFNIPADCTIYGRRNPVPGTGRPGVSDIDFLIGADFTTHKVPGNDWFPVLYIYSDCKNGWYYSLFPPVGNTGCCGCDKR